MPSRIRSILDALLHRSRLEERMDSELRDHIEAYTNDLIRSGIDRAEAERLARVEFGALEAVKEQCRDARGLRWPEELRQDTRYAFRALRNAPGFTTVAVLSLALGIGVNTAIFSVVDAALIRPLPYRDSARLVTIYENHTSRGERHSDFANANFVDLRANAPSFEDIAAHTSTGVSLTGAGEAEQLMGRLVTGNVFAVLGARARLGRTLIPEDGEPGKPLVILLSSELWKRKFGGDAAIVGWALNLDGKSYTVIGVMPAGFRFPGARDEFWLPLRFNAQARQQRSNHNLQCIGRLKASANLRQAQVQASLIARRLQREYPDTNAGIDFNLLPLRESLTRSVRTALILLLVTVGLLLLIACANVGNLVLTRSTARRHELAVRAALGAGRWRLIRQMLTESLCMALLAGIVALSLCIMVTGVLRRLLPPKLIPTGEIRIDTSVLCFGLLLSIAAGLLCGLAPALLMVRRDLQDSLAGSSRSAKGSGMDMRTRSVLVAGEVSLTLILLIGAGLLLRSFMKVTDVDPGFKPESVLAVRFALPRFLYPSQAKRNTFYQRLLEAMETVPNVRSAALITSPPFTYEGGSSWFVREGRPALHPEELIADNRLVSARYFETLGMRLREGRTFSSHDTADAPPVAVINERMASRFWPGESPVGKRFRFNDRPWVEVIGIVGNVHQAGLDVDPAPEIYRPFVQDDQVWLAPRALILRTRGEPALLARSVRQEFEALDRNVPIYGLDTMDTLLDHAIASRRLEMLLVSAFGCLALMLAAVGIYGVVSYGVAQRRQEIGIRMALGATRSRVIGLILLKALGPVLFGILIGLASALALSGYVSPELYQVKATDALTYSALPLLLVVIAACAAFFPSRRAARIDPMLALRHD